MNTHTQPLNAADQLLAARRSRAPQRDQRRPRHVLLLTHPRLSTAVPMADEMSAWLKERSIAAETVQDGEHWPADDFRRYDLVVALGGDGWMLRAGRLTAESEVPVLGVNLGRLGFLAEVQPDEWRTAFEHVLEGDYWIEQRMMLHTSLWRGDQHRQSFEVLNDVVITRGGVVRPVRLETYIDGGLLTTYVADGLIIATPTGSTAYALAVSGPILPPDLKNILLIPVAPHLSMDRAIVLARGSSVTVVAYTEHQAVISGDGTMEEPLADGDRIVVEASPHHARFVRVQDPGYFYRTLMARMGQNPAARFQANPHQ